MLDILLAVAAVASIFFSYLQGKKSGEATTTVDNYEEVAANVRKARAVRRAVTPGTPEFDELRKRYSRK